MSHMSTDKLLPILEGRFDHHSARAIFKNALAHTGLKHKTHLEAADVDAICRWLDRHHDRTETIQERMRHLVVHKNADAQRSNPDPDRVAAFETLLAALPSVHEEPEPTEEAVLDPTMTLEPLPEPQSVPVTVVLRGVPTEPGDHVRLCGDLEGLGAWDPEASVVCHPDAESGHWHTSLNLPEGQTAHFKAVIISPDNDPRWEDVANRKVEVMADTQAALDITWDQD